MEMTQLAAGTTNQPPDERTATEALSAVNLDVLRARVKTLGEAIGVDQANAMKLLRLDQRIAARRLDLRKREEELDLCRGSHERLKDLALLRAETYEGVFALLEAQDRILHELYEPLEARLRDQSAALKRLQLTVARQVDLDAWSCLASSDT